MYPWSHTKSLSAWYLINCWCKCHQIYNFGAVGDKDDLIGLWCHGSLTRDDMWSNKNFGRHFLAYLYNAWTYFNETHHSYSLPSPRDTHCCGVKGQGYRQHFPKNALFRLRHTDRWYAIEDCLVSIMYVYYDVSCHMLRYVLIGGIPLRLYQNQLAKSEPSSWESWTWNLRIWSFICKEFGMFLNRMVAAYMWNDFFFCCPGYD